MADDRSPTVRHRRLTQLFRQLRERSGLTREEVARGMEWHGSKVSKIETGQWKRLQPRDVRGLLEIYGVTDKAEQDVYVQLARDAGKRGWWAPYGDVAASYVGLEDEAASIKTFEPLYVPGLLQTEDYARALFESNPVHDADEVERRVEMRMKRQKLLSRPDAPRFWAIMDEAAIRRPVGDGKVMRDQLIHLIQARSQHLTIQIVPVSAGAHPGMEGSFVLLDYADPADRPLVYLETGAEGLYLEDDAMIARYRMMFDHLRAMALGPADSAQMLRSAAAGLVQ